MSLARLGLCRLSLLNKNLAKKVSEMSNAKNIKAELNNILLLIHHAHESYKVLHYLWTSSEDETVDMVKRTNMFLAYSKEVYFKHTIAELSKLYNAQGNEHFNLNHFKNKLFKHDEYNGVIPNDVLKKWSVAIKAIDPITDKIIQLRHGYVAHSNRDFKTEDYPLTLNDLKEVITVAMQIAKDIYLIIDNAGYSDDPIGSPVQNLKFIVGELANKHKQKMRPYIDEAKRAGDIDELPDWAK